MHSLKFDYLIIDTVINGDRKKKGTAQHPAHHKKDRLLLSGRSRLLHPTNTLNRPDGIFHCCTSASHDDKSLRRSWKVSVVEFPGSRSVVRSNPRRTLGAVGISLLGKLRYSCGTVAPATVPVFVTVNVTVARTSYSAGLPPGGGICDPNLGGYAPTSAALMLVFDTPTLDSEKLVYESPKPNS